jgi:ATP-dependent DNA helicase RecG
MKKCDNTSEITELLEAPEGEHYQFKEAKNRFDFSEALKICCALANCGGGKLVLGITDKRPRKVVGSEAFEQPERVREILASKLRVKVDFVIYKDKEKRVLVFDIASRPIGVPVQVDGIAWWYDNDSHVPIPPDVLREIYFEAEPDFSGDICAGATLNDFDDTAVDVFRNMWADDSGNSRIKNLSVVQLMTDCGVIINDNITDAALILFGNKTTKKKYLPQSEIIFEYRSSNAAGPAQQRDEFRVGFFAAYDKIWELIDLRNDLQHYQDGFQVLGVSTFNERITREALLNAASHRSYLLGGSIFVKQYKDRLVINSPGGFPSGINVDNILEMQSPRNHLIAGVFSLCGLVERAGQGMNLIYELCAKEAKPLPEFSGSDSFFINLTLNGIIRDEKLILLFKRIGTDVTDNFITEDYLIIYYLFFERRLSKNLRSRVKHLVEIGIVEHLGRGKYVLSKSLYESAGDSLTHSNIVNQDRETNKKMLYIHIKTQNSTGTSLSELMLLLPTYTRSQIQKLVYELRDEGKICKVGKTHGARWHSV